MRAWTIVAYTFDGDIYHPECVPECEEDEKQPVFATDYEGGDTCGSCREEIE